MIKYSLKTLRHGDIYSIHSPQIEFLTGYGKTQDEAFAAFVTQMLDYFNQRISKGLAIPAPIEVPKNKKLGDGIYTMPLSEEFTVLLHNTMLKKGVSKTQLAKLLALSGNDISSQEWNLSYTLTVEPSNPPKYKKVQRLLDIKHDSTLEEITEAFRVLDCVIDLDIRDKANLARHS